MKHIMMYKQSNVKYNLVNHNVDIMKMNVNVNIMKMNVNVNNTNVDNVNVDNANVDNANVDNANVDNVNVDVIDNSKEELQLGWCQGYNALKYHMEEALLEKGIIRHNLNNCPPIALFSRKYYNQINELNHDKVYDFCFIGSINSNRPAREWVIQFAKKYFTNKSTFINTDNDPTWTSLGPYDYSNKNIGYCPKNMPNNQSKQVQYRIVKENIDYFEKMCQSKFVLCPAGDAPWSFRFYEILMCKSIPIVESWHHTYRTPQEAMIDYKYVLYKDIETCINYESDKNTMLFETHHLLKI